MVILLVGGKMAPELIYARSKQRYLHLGRPRVSFMYLVFAYNFLFALGLQCQIEILLGLFAHKRPILGPDICSAFSAAGRRKLLSFYSPPSVAIPTIITHELYRYKARASR
jgi:hypothetical protein